MSLSNRPLAVSILDFLRRELSSPNVSDAAKESLEGKRFVYNCS